MFPPFIDVLKRIYVGLVKTSINGGNMENLGRPRLEDGICVSHIFQSKYVG